MLISLRSQSRFCEGFFRTAVGHRIDRLNGLIAPCHHAARPDPNLGELQCCICRAARRMRRSSIPAARATSGGQKQTTLNACCPPPWSIKELVAQATASSMWLRSGDRYCSLSRCHVRRGALALRGIWVPIGIYSAKTATVDNVRLALVNGVMFTDPGHGVAFVRHMTPLGVPLLVCLTRWHVRAKGSC